MSDVVVVSEDYVTSETDNEIPENLKTVDEIVKHMGKKKIYKVRFKRTTPAWLLSDADGSDAEVSKKKKKKASCCDEKTGEKAKVKNT